MVEKPTAKRSMRAFTPCCRGWQYQPIFTPRLKGKSYISNAAAHKAAVSLVKIDIKQFFPSVSRAQKGTSSATATADRFLAKWHWRPVEEPSTALMGNGHPTKGRPPRRPGQLCVALARACWISRCSSAVSCTGPSLKVSLLSLPSRRNGNW